MAAFSTFGHRLGGLARQHLTHCGRKRSHQGTFEQVRSSIPIQCPDVLALHEFGHAHCAVSQSEGPRLRMN
jgi:hypothetical protein